MFHLVLDLQQIYIKYTEININGCRVGSDIVNVYMWYESKRVQYLLRTIPAFSQLCCDALSHK